LLIGFRDYSAKVDIARPCVKGIGKQYRGLRTRYLATGVSVKIGKGHKESHAQ
jgi:hypothetical protein